MKKPAQTLAKISPARLERFLTELANLQEELSETRYFESFFADFIPPFHRTWVFDQAQIEENEELKSSFPPTVQDRMVESIGAHVWMLPFLQSLVRRLWIEPDARQREWNVFIIRYHLYSVEQDLSLEGAFLDLNPNANRFPRIPPPTPFEQALSYLVKYADRARYCANPECSAPYFFVQRKNQRYCSEICAAPAQRELKRQWWAEHGEEWRAARQGKKSGKRRASNGKSAKKPKQTTRKRGK